MPLRDEQWIVATVRPCFLSEFRGQLVLRRLEIVPIWQSPISWSSCCSADICFKSKEISTMPRQEIPTAMLTLVPEAFDVSPVRLRACTPVTELLPELLI